MSKNPCEIPITSAHVTRELAAYAHTYEVIFKLVTVSNYLGYARVQACGDTSDQAIARAADDLYTLRYECTEDDTLFGCASTMDRAEEAINDLFFIADSVIGFECLRVTNLGDARPQS